jgi:CRISPR/Cas system CMR-associated protein Cmr1 (group 7 of RAMP superfamily)
MKTYKLKFITPCFCGGASPTVAEIRVPSIRGELRWWFRCLGGSLEQEERIFGSVRDRPVSSSLLIRVASVGRNPVNYAPTYVKPDDPGNYLHYWLTAPNSRGESRMWSIPPDGKRKGSIREESQVAPGSSFDLVIHRHRLGDDDAERLLTQAILCLLNFGCIGFRKTRGFGAWALPPEELPTLLELQELLKNLPTGFSHKLAPATNADSLQVLRQVETRLKANKRDETGLRFNHKADDKTPLGYSLGSKRQASAVRFRPVAFRTSNGAVQFTLLTFQAPDSVLGEEVRQHRPGATRIL